jgi:hypothetical protein
MSTARPRPPTQQQKWSLSFNFPQTGVGATGTVTADTNTNMADGDKVVLSDGVRFVTYEYDKAANGVTAGNVAWTAGTTAATVATNLRTAIIANQPGLTVTDNLAGVLTITNNWPGAGGNVTITKTSSSALAVTGMAGGVNPAGSVLADTTIKLFKAKTRSVRIDRVQLNLPAGLANSSSNYCDFKIIKGASTLVAHWSTQNTAQGTITADTPVELVNTSTVADRFLADGDTLSLFLDVTGTPTVPPGRLVIEGYEL